MSCGLAIAAVLLLANPDVALAAAVPVVAADAPVSVASEPLFADIVSRASVLKAVVDGWSASGTADQDGFVAGQAFAAVKAGATELAALDMQGHIVLRDRGMDGDLKCILRGISEDIPGRIAAIEAATSPQERAVALAELSHLLDDNVAVITAPPAPEV